eukprot:1792930-Lingulodinium_polyedra.AAC.1
MARRSRNGSSRNACENAVVGCRCLDISRCVRSETPVAGHVFSNVRMQCQCTPELHMIVARIQ